MLENVPKIGEPNCNDIQYTKWEPIPFKKVFSITDTLLEIPQFIYNKINSDWKCIEVFLDLAKAFDAAQYDILLSKLKVVSIKRIALGLVKSFLLER